MNHLAIFLSRLKNVRPRGNNKWMACCPAHDDRSPSLSITTGDKGQILAWCFAECPIDQIVSAIDLNLSDLYPPASRAKSGFQTKRSPMPGWTWPGSERRLRESIQQLFLLAATAYPLGSVEREMAADAMSTAIQILGDGGAK